MPCWRSAPGSRRRMVEGYFCDARYQLSRLPRFGRRILCSLPVLDRGAARAGKRRRSAGVCAADHGRHGGPGAVAGHRPGHRRGHDVPGAIAAVGGLRRRLAGRCAGACPRQRRQRAALPTRRPRPTLYFAANFPAGVLRLHQPTRDQRGGHRLDVHALHHQHRQRRPAVHLPARADAWTTSRCGPRPRQRGATSTS